MARAKTNKLYRTFVKGLITEAGYLTYPEDASTAELNTVLSRKGNRTRRLGINFEDGHTLVSIPFRSTDAIQEYLWSNANNDPGQNFIAIQVGSKVHFFVIDEGPVSNNKAPFIVDLLDYKTPGSTTEDIRTTPASFASGAGYLFVCHENCHPLNVEFKPETNSIVVVSMIIQIRDLDGVDDGLANDMEPTTLSKEHHYNLLNQGWGPPDGSRGGHYYNPHSGAPSSGAGSTGTESPYSPSTGGGYTQGDFDRRIV